MWRTSNIHCPTKIINFVTSCILPCTKKSTQTGLPLKEEEEEEKKSFFWTWPPFKKEKENLKYENDELLALEVNPVPEQNALKAVCRK